ncbi:hypothetical protein C8Q77DRAFT_1127952 [Trametes polyzona]|nr:hypothetical protein C8Q77DRAFT_1127952 [Trametes polyzona]
MRLHLCALAAITTAAGLVGAAPAARFAAPAQAPAQGSPRSTGMPLPLFMASRSSSARAPNAYADPFALPWGVHRS